MRTIMAKNNLTPKRQAFVDLKLANPTMSNADAVLQAGYRAKSTRNASNMATEILKQPAVQMYLQNHVDLAESAVITTIQDFMKSDRPRQREIATQNAQWLHDKVFGKATARVEIHSEVFNVNIDLTGNNEAPPEDDKILDLTED